MICCQFFYGSSKSMKHMCMGLPGFATTDLFRSLLSTNSSPSLRAELEEGEKCTNSRRSQRSSSIDGDHSLALNRVDLISRTIETLEMIYREKEESEARASEISQAGNDFAAARQAIKDDRVSHESIDNVALVLLHICLF